MKLKKIFSIVALAALAVVTLFTATACGGKVNYEDILSTYIFDKDNMVVNESTLTTLPATFEDANGKTYTATWTSSDATIQIADKANKEGLYTLTYNYPASETVTVTLTVSLGNAKQEYTVKVRPLGASDFADQYTFPYKRQVLSDQVIDLANEVVWNGKKATITWSSDSDLVSIDGYKATISHSTVKVSAKLTATFTYGTDTYNRSYDFFIYYSMTPEEKISYWYNNSGISQEISGYIVEFAAAYDESYGNVSLYVMDDSGLGGYYLYRASVKDATIGNALEIGSHITFTGSTNTNYNGLIETNAGGSLVISDAPEGAITKEQALTYYEMSNDYVANAQSLYYRMSTLVKVEGWKVKSIDKTDFAKGGSAATVLTLTQYGVELAIKMSKYMDGHNNADVVNALNAKLKTLAVGDYVDVKGVLSYYNATQYLQAGYQLIVQDADSITKLESGADKASNNGTKVAAAVKEVAKNFPNMVTENKDITFPKTSGDVTVSYALSTKYLTASITDATVTFAPNQKLSENVVIVATFTSGDYSTKVRFTVKTILRDDAGKVADELAAIELEDTISGTYDLQEVGKTYGNVAITWAVKDSSKDLASVKDGKLELLSVDEATEITLVATATCGEASDSIEVTFKVLPLSLTKYVAAATPAENTAYKFGLYQGNVSKWYFSDGAVTSKGYCTTVEDYTTAPDFYVEVVEGGYNVYTMVSGAKKYMNAVVSGDYNNVAFEDVASTVWTWNEAHATFVANMTGHTTDSKDGEYYIGCYSTYDTFSFSAISYIERCDVDNAANFCVKLFTVTDDKTDTQGRADAEINNFVAEVIGTSGLQLPLVGTNYSDVKFSYEIAENAYVTIKDGFVTVVKQDVKAVTLTITVTAKCGVKTATKNVDFTLEANAVVQTIAEFLAAKDAESTVLLEGVVTAVNKVGQAGSFELTDASGSVFCYTNVDVALGDKIKILAKYSENNSFPQLGSPSLVEKTGTVANVAAVSGTLVSYSATDVKKDIDDKVTNEELITKYAGKYLAITGYILKSGNYYGVACTKDDTTYVVNLYQNSGIDLASLAGQEVIVYGFARGVYSGKNITIQVQSVAQVATTE